MSPCLWLVLFLTAAAPLAGQRGGVLIGGAQPDEVTALARDASGAVCAARIVPFMAEVRA